MGKYAIDTSNLYGRDFETYHEKSIRERNNLRQAVENTVLNGTVDTSEVKQIFQDSSNPVLGQASIVHRNPDTGILNVFFRTGGQSSFFLGQLNENTGLIENKAYPSLGLALEPDRFVYFPKKKSYAVISSSTVEFLYGDDFLKKFESINFDDDYNNQKAFDVENNKVYTLKDFGGGTYGVVEYDLDGSNFITFSGYKLFNAGPSLWDLAGNVDNYRYLSYNNTLKKLTIIDENGQLYVIDPNTVGQSLSPIGSIFGIPVAYKEVPNSNEAYVVSFSNGICTLYRVNLEATNQSDFIMSFRFLRKGYGTEPDVDTVFIKYTDKAVVLTMSNEPDTETDDLNLASYAKVFSRDLQYDLVNERRFYEKTDKDGVTEMNSPSTLRYDGTISQNAELTTIRPVDFVGTFVESISETTDRIYFPVHFSGAGPGGLNSFLQYIDIFDRVDYPSLDSNVVNDCGLTELQDEIKCKISSYGCNVTNKSIVGRHYVKDWEKARKAEAMLWVTEFDCLTCDEIETLKCLISKI